MRLKAVVAVVALACVSVLLGAYGLSAIAAETQTDYNFPPVIQKLVEKFNLDPAEVNGVLQEDRKEREAKREAMIEERLDQEVKEGTITEKQKEAILAKMKEMQEKLEVLKGLSPEERHEAMQQLREDTTAWAKENSIDAKWLLMGPRKGFGPGGFCGFGFKGGPWQKN
ncbi:MAG: hypothetical protein STSR0004_22620 [Peptococcaceae bacterium]